MTPYDVTMTPSATARRRLPRRCGRFGVVALAALILTGVAACSSDGDADTASETTTDVAATEATTDDSEAPDTTAAETVVDTGADTAPDSTDATDSTDASDTTDTTDPLGTSSPGTNPRPAPTTTPTTASTPPATPPATEAPTTTIADAFPRGWQPVESFPAGVYAPLEQSNWIGVPSPPLPVSPGEPLADGLYPVDAVWDPADPTSLSVEVQRLALCNDAPEFACISFEGPFQPEEVGVDDSVSYPMTVPLDGSIGVGLIGYECDGAAGRGNGADLASLFLAWDEAYHRTIAPQIEAGIDDFTVMEAIAATPTDGFAGANTDCPDFGFGGLVFRTGDAPPVLHQIISRLDDDNERVLLTVTEVVYPHTVHVVDGEMTFYWYAGFLS